MIYPQILLVWISETYRDSDISNNDVNLGITGYNLIKVDKPSSEVVFVFITNMLQPS